MQSNTSKLTIVVERPALRSGDLFGDWMSALEKEPETFQSVIVFGRLEEEFCADTHEGFFDGRQWWSVRQRESDPDAKKRIHEVTHWNFRPLPPSPNAKSSNSHP